MNTVPKTLSVSAAALACLIGFSGAAAAKPVLLTVEGTLTADNYDSSGALTGVGSAGDAFKLTVQWDDSLAPDPNLSSSSEFHAFKAWNPNGVYTLFLNGRRYKSALPPPTSWAHSDLLWEEGNQLRLYSDTFDTTSTFIFSPGNAISTYPGGAVSYIETGLHFQMRDPLSLAGPDELTFAYAVDQFLANLDTLDRFYFNFMLEDFIGNDDFNGGEFDIRLRESDLASLSFSLTSGAAVPSPGALALLGLGLAGLSLRRSGSCRTAISAA